MARIDFDPTTLPDFERRINALLSTGQRQWGTMSLAQMLSHLRITVEVSLEERETHNESRAWLTSIVYLLMFCIFTKWPKGKVPTSKQFLDDSAEDIETERTLLLESAQRFVEEAEKNSTRITLEPMLGHISLQKWKRVHGIHIDHHLRQFGV